VKEPDVQGLVLGVPKSDWVEFLIVSNCLKKETKLLVDTFRCEIDFF
jgi:hypothetical protein